MLYIKNSKDVKITKVTGDYKIFFSYEGNRYLLHCSTADCEDTTTLYLRKPTHKDGVFTLEVVASTWGHCVPTLDYYGKRPCYAKVKIDRFVQKLTDFGLIKSCYSEKNEKIEIEKKLLRENIAILQEKLRKLEAL